MDRGFSFSRRLATFAAALSLTAFAPSLSAQAVFGWGNNQQGQLGTGTHNMSSVPVRISGLLDVVAIAAGTAHTLVLKSDGTVWAWGSNTYGQLGNGTANESSVPVQVQGLDHVASIAAGSGTSFAVKSDGTVWGWGLSEYGELGAGGGRYVPMQVTGLSGIVAVASRRGHMLALKSDGTVWGLGQNSDGQLGDGTRTSSAVPVRAASLIGIKAIAAGAAYSIALDGNGTIWGWGLNTHGQIGARPAAGAVAPMQIARLPGATSIAAGDEHNLAVLGDGTVWAWGNNTLGQLGTGPSNPDPNPVPARVPGLSGIVAVAAGSSHSLAMKSDGAVWAWGWNGYGQLGIGNFNSSSVPVPVAGFNGATSVAAGDLHSVAIQKIAVTAPPAIDAVVNGASFLPGISASAWVSVFGKNLSQFTRLWRADEIVNGRLPTQLEGVSVTVDGKPAAVSYVSPTQLNVQVPETGAAGSVQVQVTTPLGAATAVADLRPFAPGLFTYDGKYAAAQHTNYIAVANVNQFGNVLSSPAQPGEVVIIYGTGFGPTIPAMPAGQVISGPALLATPVKVRFYYTEAQVIWAGLSAAGLWQFNVKVPDNMPDGDAPVTVEVGDVFSQPNVYITVKRL